MAAPHSAAPHSAAPHSAAPHVDAPHVDAPHMAAPHVGLQARLYSSEAPVAIGRLFARGLLDEAPVSADAFARALEIGGAPLPVRVMQMPGAPVHMGGRVFSWFAVETPLGYLRVDPVRNALALTQLLDSSAKLLASVEAAQNNSLTLDVRDSALTIHRHELPRASVHALELDAAGRLRLGTGGHQQLALVIKQ